MEIYEYAYEGKGARLLDITGNHPNTYFFRLRAPQ